MKNDWDIGDEYKIEENGKKLVGKIIGVDFTRGFIVEWDDKTTTFEKKPSPKVGRADGK